MFFDPVHTTRSCALLLDVFKGSFGCCQLDHLLLQAKQGQDVIKENGPGCRTKPSDPLLRLLTLPQECVTKLHALSHRQRKQPVHTRMQYAEVSPDSATSR